MKKLMTVLAVVFVGLNIYAVKHFGDLGLIPKEVFMHIVWGSGIVATLVTTASTIYFTKKLK